MIDATRLRLALFSDTYLPQINGVSRTLDRLVAAVAARGGAAKVFTVADPSATTVDHVARYASVPFWAYDQLRLSWPADADVQNELRAFTPSLVHAATEFGVGLAGRRAARAMRIPFVSSYHTSFAAYAKFYRLGALATPGWAFLRWFHNGGLRTYCPTQSIVDEVATEGFINTAVWSRGVDCERFSPAYRSAAFRERIGATEDTLVVLYVGRLAAEKGLDVGLEALRIANDARPGRIRFAAVGDGPYADEVHARAPQGSWLPGPLSGDALSEAFASADLFLFPSTTDTFGNVLLEAMASGLPAIGANVGPTREQLAPDRGWLAPPGAADAFAELLLAVLDDRLRLLAAKQAALAHAATKTWDAVWDALIGDYLVLHRPQLPTQPSHSRHNVFQGKKNRANS